MASTVASWLSSAAAAAQAHPIAAGVAAVAVVAVVASKCRRKPAPKPETWEQHVLPHGPLLEAVPDMLWHLVGTLKYGPDRRMVIYRPPGSGDLIVHSGIAVNEETLAAITALGKPAVLIVPNSFHRADAAVWKARFPDILVAAPADATAAVSSVVPVDMDAAQLPARYPGAVWAYTLKGWNKPGKVFEFIFEFALGDAGPAAAEPSADDAGQPPRDIACKTALVCADTFFNVKRTGKFGKDFMGHIFGNLTDGKTPIPSSLARWFFIADKAEVAASLRQMSQERHSITHILVAHGEAVQSDDCAGMFGIMAHIVDGK